MAADKDKFVLQIQILIGLWIIALIQEDQIHRIIPLIDRIALLHNRNRLRRKVGKTHFRIHQIQSRFLDRPLLEHLGFQIPDIRIGLIGKDLSV